MTPLFPGVPSLVFDAVFSRRVSNFRLTFPGAGIRRMQAYNSELGCQVELSWKMPEANID
jgi:hypothetical protein